MFLRTLNNEQKELFLGLATYAANANAVIEEGEKRLLEAFADEMSIDIANASKLSQEEILKRLKEISDDKEINQMAFEIVAMMISDKEYDDDEKMFMNNLCTRFDISNEKLDKMFELINKYYDIVRDINLLMYEV